MRNCTPKKIRCQCPKLGEVLPEREYLYAVEEKSGMNHKPNKCKGTNNIKKYRRGDNTEVYLCSCCTTIDDVEIKGRKK